MSVNVEIVKTGNESALSTIRKFSRKVQGTGLVKNARKRRYFARDTSKIVKKKRALKLIKRRADYNRKVKEGKVIEAPKRRGGYSRPNTNTSTSTNNTTTQTTPSASTPIAR